MIKSGIFGFRGLKAKMAILVALPIIGIMALGALSINSINFQMDISNRLSRQELPETAALLQARSAINEVMRMTWWAYSFDMEQKERRKDKIDEANVRMEKFDKKLAEVEKLTKAGGRSSDIDAVKEIIADWEAAKPHLRKAYDLMLAGSDTSARLYIVGNVSKKIYSCEDQIDKLVKHWEEETNQYIAESERETGYRKSIFLLISALVCIFGAVFGTFLAWTLSRQLIAVSGKVNEVGTQVLTASEQLSSASQSLSAGATESASSLEETVSALEELSSTVKMNADNAREAASLSMTTSAAAIDGEKEIRDLIQSVNEISTSSKKIEEIINVIDDIAFQTNLLALNAAVEAARAGEQGKGFAVVADAVRTLAQRSAAAAKDITGLIKDSVDKSTRGSAMADKSGTVLANIVTSVKKVSDLNNEIAQASQEQSSGIGQISKAMNELDQSTQKNAAMAEEVAASSEELSAQAIQMQENVRELNGVVLGDQGTQESYHEHHSPSVPRRRTAVSPPSNVVQFKKTRTSPSPKSQPSGRRPEDLIPFDDMEPAKKVGTTDGF